MNKELRKLWRETVITGDTWILDPPKARPTDGVTQGQFVKCDLTGVRGFMKPLTGASGPRVASYEKLASNFGYELELSSILPVVLYAKNDAKPGEQKWRAIVMCPPPDIFQWSDLDGHKDHDVQDRFNKMLHGASETLALDAWLGNGDRNKGPNTIFSVGSDDRAFYLDYANIIDWGNQWHGDNYKVFRSLGLNQAAWQNNLDKEAVLAAAKRISSLPETAIDAIVNELPDGFMPLEERKSARERLVWRQNKLVDRFTDWWPGPHK